MNISVDVIIVVLVGLFSAIFGALWGHQRSIAHRVTHDQCSTRRKECPCAKEMEKIKSVRSGRLAVALLFVGVALALPGCQAMDNLTESVKEKNIALGSSGWALEMSAGMDKANAYVPNFSLRGGKLRTFYISLKDAAGIQVMPDIIHAANNDITVTANQDGITVTEQNQKKD